MRNDVIVHEGYNAARQLIVAVEDHTKHVDILKHGYSAKESGVGLS